MRAAASLLIALALAGCGNGSTLDDSGLDAQTRDGRPGLDSATPLDGAHPPDLGTGDAGVPDSDLRDAQLVSTDIGPPATGEACATAFPWEDPQVTIVAGTTSTSLHREQLTCGVTGPGANAPEVWWTFDLAETRHVILRLGTQGWDGVLAARTGTCTRTFEMCSDAPPIVELPAVEGPVFVAVDGFSSGRGLYAIEAEISDPLFQLANTECTLAEEVTLPFTTTAHNFEGSIVDSIDCPLDYAIFYELEAGGSTPLSAVASPLAGQDLDLAIFDGCDGTPVACARTLGRGVSEVIGPLSVPAGRYIVAVGAHTDRPVLGSFSLSLGEAADCRRDADCPIQERCTELLTCGPRGMFTATSTARRAIPDGAGALEVPIELAGPVDRARRVIARVAVDHPFVEDLVIELIAPGAPEIRTRLRNRRAGPSDITYGVDRPADGPGSLEDFAIAPIAAGTWILRIEDRGPGDRGDLIGYAIGVE